MSVISMKQLLEAGVHFGHQTKRWNPKMKEYIFTSRDDIYIIDLEKTASCIESAYAEIKKIAENGGNFLFVGTKKQANEAAKEEVGSTITDEQRRLSLEGKMILVEPSNYFDILMSTLQGITRTIAQEVSED